MYILNEKDRNLAALHPLIILQGSPSHAWHTHHDWTGGRRSDQIHHCASLFPVVAKESFTREPPRRHFRFHRWEVVEVAVCYHWQAPVSWAILMHELDLSTFIFLVRAVAVASRAHSVTWTLVLSSSIPARQRDHWILRSGHIHRTPPCLHTDTPETICNTGYGMAIPSQREWLQQCYQVDDWSDCNGSVHIINLMWLEHYSCATFWNHSLALLPYPFRNYICVQSDVMLHKWIQLVGRHACAYCAMIGAPSQTLTKNDFPHAAMVTSCHYGHCYWLLQYGVHPLCCNMSLCEAARSLMRQKQVQLMDVDVAVIITVVVILTVSQVNIM